jgi:hypothetical protein
MKDARLCAFLSSYLQFKANISKNKMPQLYTTPLAITD